MRKQKIQEGESAVGMQRREQSFLNSGTWRSIPKEMVFGWVDRMATGGSHPLQTETQNEQSHEKVRVSRKDSLYN